MMFRSVFASYPSLFKPFYSTPSLSRPAFSKLVFAVAAALVLGALPAATEAVAQRYGDDGGGFRTRRFGQDGFPGSRLRGREFGPRPGFAERRGPAFRGGYPPPAFRNRYPEDGANPRPFARRFYRNGRFEYVYYGCDRWRWAATPSGWRWRRVNVCFPSSYY
jgi:hypothetical protein